VQRQTEQVRPARSSLNKAAVARPIARLLLICLCLAVVAELAMRFALGLGNPVLLAPDASCEYTLKPSQNIYRFFVHTYINRWGMRSGEVAHLPGEGTVRIMFVGDSITYGTSHVDQKDIFTEIVHRDLPEIVHRPVEVLNASAGAWAIDNELSFVHSRGTFGSEVVVEVLNTGDLTQPVATLSSVGSGYFTSRPGSAIGELWDRFFEKSRGADAGDQTDMGAKEQIRHNLEDLNQMKTITAQSHARFVIVYIPIRKEIPFPSEQSREILADWAMKHGVAFLDLTEVEKQYPVRKITFEGVHLNREGNALVASYLETHLPALIGVEDK
jgi:hypothetical protein